MHEVARSRGLNEPANQLGWNFVALFCDETTRSLFDRIQNIVRINLSIMFDHSVARPRRELQVEDKDWPRVLIISGLGAFFAAQTILSQQCRESSSCLRKSTGGRSLTLFTTEKRICIHIIS